MVLQLVSLPRYSIFSLLLLLFYLVTTLAAKPISSFSLNCFRKEAGSDPPEITLFGDAQVGCGGDCVHVTKSEAFSGGRLVYKNPIRFRQGNPSKPLSFSSYFEFSISPGHGDGLAFVVLPTGFPVLHSFGLDKYGDDGVLVVQFRTLLDRNVSDLNGNHAGATFTSSLLGKASSIKFVLGSGKRLHSWIDYEASSKRLEVRLSGSGSRPYDPLLSYSIDLCKMWKEEEMFVGFTSSNGNSTQSVTVYSWSFKLRHIPSWFHSLPLNPHYPLYPSEHQQPRERNVCLSKILTTIVFCISCAALAVFIVLLIKAIFANAHAAVVPVEYPVHPVELGYKKIKIGAEKATTDAKKVEP